MYFGEVAVSNAEGCYLAHSQQTRQGRIAKGRRIDQAIIARLLDNHIASVTVARLDSTDTHENDAADAVASALCGVGVRASTARHGRVNLHAREEGLCCLTAYSLLAANAVDEAITIATIAENQWVPSGKMLATIKIIPYGVATDNMHKVIQLLSHSPVSVAEPLAHTVDLIQTRLPTIADSTLDKTRRITQLRLDQRSAVLRSEMRCDHSVNALVELISHSVATGAQWLLIFGASAISDRNDVIPAAIVQTGGQIDRYGLAVDPGNLLLLAHIGSTVVIGMPGCARSPRHNGLDRLLDRMACDIALTADWLNSLSVGGLLTEIADRPNPRIQPSKGSATEHSIAALLLAAGQSTRAGSRNKLLHHYQGKPMVSHVAEQLRLSNVSRLVAVTGHERGELEHLLGEQKIDCIYNAAYPSGMASSLAKGVSELIESDAIIVCLGDMPHVTAKVINQLITAFATHVDKAIFIPTYKGKLGNPMMISKVFFDTLLTLEGDSGARFLIAQYPAQVQEVAVDCPGIHQDFDTAAELNSLHAE